MTVTRHAVHFICTADAQVGFGHLRRCLTIGRLLQNRQVQVSLSGVLDEAALGLIRQVLPEALQRQPAPEDTAVVDCMFDPRDMDFYDVRYLQEIRARHARTVMLTSAMAAPPELPVDVVVGHMLDPVPKARYEVRCGLAWAPVAPDALAYRVARRAQPVEVRRVLLAFGNFHDPTGLFLALEALASMPGVSEVQVLLPPALRPFEDKMRRQARDIRLEVLRDVPSVFPLLAQSDLVVGSYGNLTFEALCLGVPVVLLAIKEFMVRYAARLEAAGCLVLAGEARNLSPAELGGLLRGLDQARRTALAVLGQQLVDGEGLRRTAELIDRWANGSELEPQQPKGAVPCTRTEGQTPTPRG